MGAYVDALRRPRRHNRPSGRLESPVSSQYLKFMCVQVRVRSGNPVILPTQRPTDGTVRGSGVPRCRMPSVNAPDPSVG